MPVEMRMWRIDGDKPQPLNSARLPSEKDLEDFLEKDPTLLGTKLLVIGRQVHTPYGKFIDLLAIDADGNLHVLELKRDKTDREVAAQALDYGSWVATLTREEVITLANFHLDEPLEAEFETVFSDSLPDELNAELQLTLVASDLDSSSERIVTYLRTFGVPINAVFFSYLVDGNREYLARSWLVDEDASAKSRIQARSKRAAWNGLDWYVAFGGSSVDREWEDARRFGFVSAGGGLRYSNRLHALRVGDRVNVHIPGKGYVAVGVTTGVAQRFDEVRVEVAGASVLLADQALVGSYHHGEPDHPDNDELAEWVIPVRWIVSEPIDRAYWEAGMFGNPNPVCQLRQEFTLERLARHFDLDDE